MDKIKAIYTERRTFIIYSLIGLFGIAVDLCIFFILYNVYNIAPSIASLISGLVSIFNNFVLNYYLNFNVRNKFLKRLAKFFLTALTGLLFMSISIKILGEIMGLNPNLVKIATLAIVVLAQYNINKKVTFKSN